MQLPEYQRADLIGPGTTGAATRHALESLSLRLTVIGWTKGEIERAVEQSAANAGMSSEALMRTLGVALGLGGQAADQVPIALEGLSSSRAQILISRALLSLSDVA